MEELICLKGTVEDIKYCNRENGYTVFELSYGDDSVTVVCYAQSMAVGEQVRVEGRFTAHRVYGKQFQAVVMECTLPAGAQAIFKYLASGAVRGIGPVTAQRIVDRFGEETFEILENHPELLATVKGITKPRAGEIAKEVGEVFGTRRILAELHAMGLQAHDAVRAYSSFGSAAAEAVRTDPYMLCSFPMELRFEQADQIAMSLEIARDDDRRIAAGLQFVLEHNLKNGHTFLPQKQLILVAAKMLGVDPGQAAACLAEMEASKKIVCCPIGSYDAVYLEQYFRAESYIAARCKDMGSCDLPVFKKPEKEIAKLEGEHHIQYAPMQRQAIAAALEKGVLIITGGPGTGKTTILNAIIDLYRQENKKILLAAPTGRAAKRMSEVTGREAKTIHRLLEVEYKNGYPSFLRDEIRPLKADVVIIDEMSMVDVLLMEALLLAISPGTRLIMCGDIDQLPSVGAGNVLRDLIVGQTVETVRLTEIFRQAADSLIITNSHAINRGEYPNVAEPGKDFYFIRRSGEEEIARTVLELCVNRIPNKFHIAPEEIQVISPTKRGPAGTYMLNRALQAAINPPDSAKTQRSYQDIVFREGDKVMQVKNNYDQLWTSVGGEQGKGVWNGDMGRIDEIDLRENTMTATFDERSCALDCNLLGDLDMAYAITAHKSQGSEFPAVVIPVFYAPAKLLSRNILYTAITRARDLCVLVGEEGALRSMVDNNKQHKRFTGLAAMLMTLE